ncbi:MAG: ABC transporter ATP-binding protein [Eubacteriales bacterium]|nr:ABC transporter ATP-binding protein [Eubacteriales bacterium]MDD3863324.1 ABC transporter ATP-binding protein [Eubacteriales bacterium]
MSKVVEMKGITKIFPGTVANDHVDFDLEKGEIHVLLGENGAGKTTLMNILYGLYQQTSGDIYINGKKEDIRGPNAAIALGIGMVHQHFMLVENFTVAENIVLGHEPKKGLTLDMEAAKTSVREVSDRFGLEVDPDARIEDIPVGLSQRVEILKALHKGAEILILDEPTAVLTPQEIDDLGEILKNLTNEGKSIILITHKLKEVLGMSDRVTILRRGKVIGTVQTSETTADELAEMMVGREVNLSSDKAEKAAGEVILNVEHLTVKDHRNLPAVKDVSFEVRQGEILAIAGVDGNGQKELVEALTGLMPTESGKVTLCGKDITGASPRTVIEAGTGHIPQDRQKRGLILQSSLTENLILGYHYQPPFAKNGKMDQMKIAEHGKELIQEFDIRTPNQDVSAGSLSGGNQQKVIIAREFYKDPPLLIAAQPTRGLDVGAIEFVHMRLLEQRDNNKAVLLVSLELDEIMNLADRIAVIYHGQIVGILDAAQATERQLGLMMAGGTSADKGDVS